jgi:hypothetical protein
MSGKLRPSVRKGRCRIGEREWLPFQSHITIRHCSGVSNKGTHRQQAYRERREQLVEALKERIAAAESHCAKQADCINSLQGNLTKLQRERESLLRELRRPSLPSSIPSGSSVETMDPEEDDLLTYGASRKSSL